jgi:hypothetical protein
METQNGCAWMWEVGRAYEILIGKPLRIRLLGSQDVDWEIILNEASGINYWK